MFVIADSGSSKTDWRFISTENKDIISISTIGFNPFFVNSEEIVNECMIAFHELNKHFQSVKKVYFYGAGCSSPEKNEIIHVAMSQLFNSAQIEISNDVLAACKALFFNSKGVACILGTGSNSCVWDGFRIVENIPSNGYLFGDEGAGVYLGKKLIHLFVNNKLETDLENKFLNVHNLSKSQVLKNTYSHTRPNFYLAGFAKFVLQNRNDTQMKSIINESISDFFSVRVLPYNKKNTNRLGFVGSIAFHLREELQLFAKQNGYEIYKIIQSPIDELVQYHMLSNNDN